MPSVSFPVVVTGQREVVFRLEQLKPAVVREVNGELNRTGLAIVNGAKRRAPVDRGELRAKIGLVVRPVTDGRVIAAEARANAPHSAFVEYGTSAIGAATNRQPLPEGYQHGTFHKPIPPQFLEGWVRRKRIGEPDEVGETAAAIAFTIASRPGLPARPFMGPAADEAGAGFLDRMAKAVVRGLQKGARA